MLGSCKNMGLDTSFCSRKGFGSWCFPDLSKFEGELLWRGRNRRKHCMGSGAEKMHLFALCQYRGGRKFSDRQKLQVSVRK